MSQTGPVGVLGLSIRYVRTTDPFVHGVEVARGAVVENWKVGEQAR